MFGCFNTNIIITHILVLAVGSIRLFWLTTANRIITRYCRHLDRTYCLLNRIVQSSVMPVLQETHYLLILKMEIIVCRRGRRVDGRCRICNFAHMINGTSTNSKQYNDIGVYQVPRRRCRQTDWENHLFIW